MTEHHLETAITGRYLVEAPEGSGPFPLLAGFHGYGQTAEDELALLRQIPGSERFARCSIEALHPFINAKGKPGASWMTGCEREIRITENVRYVDTALDRVITEIPVDSRLVLHGFSQGVGMACRTAVLGRHTVTAVMFLGGDIPPELDDLAWMRAVHIGRGERDHLYRQERFDSDCARLRVDGIEPTACQYTGGHAPTEKYFKAAGKFLDAMG
ncbi:MAG TPA: phospholipase [Chlorobaculum parvum]|uniref:Phospholipase n=1 Tax=Chlorobaculum parvum TaxID=274539 RepID=A0A7C5DER8_9CHLB|nr:phospholipase [Chlorobaculum parvum]